MITRMAQPADSPDLAALLARLFPRLAELEGPVLESAGLSMWEYAILTELAGGEAVSQTDLSHRVRRDPTRLGRHLDDLVARGLVVREPSTEDRRQRTVRLTRDGRTAYRRAKRGIREVEDALLAEAFTPRQAQTLRDLLSRLAQVGSQSKGA